MEYKSIYVTTASRFASYFLPWLLNENSWPSELHKIEDSGIGNIAKNYVNLTNINSTDELNFRYDEFEEIQFQPFLEQFLSWFAIEINFELPEGIVNKISRIPEHWQARAVSVDITYHKFPPTTLMPTTTRTPMPFGSSLINLRCSRANFDVKLHIRC